MINKLTSIDMHTNGNKKDGNESKKEDGMDQNRHTTGLHVPKLHHFVSSRQLKQQPWT